MVKGVCHTSLSEFDEAERNLLRSLEMTRKGRGPNAYETRGVVMSLARMYGEWGKKEKAAEFEAEVRRIDASRKR